MDRYTRPDPEQAALLTIDMQADFSRPVGAGTVPGTAAVVPKIERLLRAFRDTGRPIVHVVRLYREDGSNVDRCRRASIEDGTEIVRPGTEGAELVSELKPDQDITLDSETLLAGDFQRIGPSERLLYKPRWSAFYGTPLEAFLRERSVNTVVICGCNFPNCPRTTVYDASQRDFRIVFVPDATSGVYERGLNELEGIDVAVMQSEEATAWLSE